MIGAHLIKAFSRTQAVVALSSAEAELYALVTAASETLGLKAVAADFGIDLGAWMWVDASAAIGIARRKGLGKVRHIETQALWVQDAICKKKLGLENILGRENPSDLQTKYLDANSIARHLKKIGAEIRSGRPEAAPDHVPGDGAAEWEHEGVNEVDDYKEILEKAGGEVRRKDEGCRAERLSLRSARVWWQERLESYDHWETVDAVVFDDEVSLERMEDTFEASWKRYQAAATCLREVGEEQ